MSAFRGKADMACALHMSAYDPKRTLVAIIHGGALAYDF